MTEKDIVQYYVNAIAKDDDQSPENVAEVLDGLKEQIVGALSKSEMLEQEEAENQFDEWIALKIDEDPDYLKEHTHDEIWKEFVGAEGTFLSNKYFEKTLGTLES